MNSCLDHVFCNFDTTKVGATVAVLDTTITDHKMIFVSICSIIYKPKVQSTRTVTNFNESLITFQTYNTTELLNITDPKILCSKLIDLITNCIEKNTKVIKIPCNKRIIKPWMTPGVLKCIQNRNRIQKQLRIDKTNTILQIAYYCKNS